MNTNAQGAMLGRAQRTIVALAVLAVLATAVLLFLPVLPSFRGPSASAERRGQRQQVLERVRSVGGWASIQKDCDALAEQYGESTFFWYSGGPNTLPPALAALKPQEVRFDSPRVLRDFKDKPQVAVVRIKIFGLASSGGHGIPYFGLQVVSGAGAETFRPSPSGGGAPGNAYTSYRPVTDRIYEVY